MNYLFITEEFAVGGIENYINYFGEYLISQKHSVKVLYWPVEDISPSKRLNSTPVNFSSKNIFFLKYLSRFIAQTKVIFQEFKNNPPKIIFLNVTRSAFFSLPALLFLRYVIKKEFFLYYNFHGSQYLELLSQKKFYQGSYKQKIIFIFRKKYYHYIENFALSTSDKIICFSRYSKRLILRTYRINPAKIVVIKPGLTSKVAKKTKKKVFYAKKQLGLNPDLPLILAIMRLEERKGMYAVLEVAEEIKKTELKHNFVLCSTFHLSEAESIDFFRYHTKLNLSTNIFFINSPDRKKIDILLSATDIFVMPSINLETFGFATLEALSHGTPVIALARGANTELIQHKKNGFLAKDTKEIALFISRYLSCSLTHQQKYWSKSIAVAKYFSWNYYFKKLSQI